MRCEELKKAVLAGEFDTRLKEVYPGRKLEDMYARIGQEEYKLIVSEVRNFFH